MLYFYLYRNTSLIVISLSLAALYIYEDWFFCQIRSGIIFYIEPRAISVARGRIINQLVWTIRPGTTAKPDTGRSDNTRMTGS